MLGRIPRRAVAATLAAAAVLIPASPALAHFCYRDFQSSTAASKAAKSGPWQTAEEVGAWLTAAAEQGQIPQCVVDDALAWLATQEETTLFMGPGLLAGGTEGTTRTPKNVNYIPIDSFGGSCSAP